MEWLRLETLQSDIHLANSEKGLDDKRVNNKCRREVWTDLKILLRISYDHVGNIKE